MTPENIKKLEAVGFVRMNYPHNPLMFSHALLDGEEFDFSAASVEGAIKILSQIYHVKGRDSAKRDIRNALGIID